MTKAKTTKQVEAPVLEALDHEVAQAAGFWGRVPDPTPNLHYTAAGDFLPTPETDAAWAKQVQARMLRCRPDPSEAGPRS